MMACNLSARTLLDTISQLHFVDDDANWQ